MLAAPICAIIGTMPKRAKLTPIEWRWGYVHPTTGERVLLGGGSYVRAAAAWAAAAKAAKGVGQRTPWLTGYPLGVK